jgi:2,3-bisphosphoglycerate-independent phosphoglycerate mutase
MGKSILIILDGWGINHDATVSAIEAAHTPVFNNLITNYPHATLVTHGESVGLPDGQMGNSEVGHLNIGAGRIIYQDLTRINKDIREDQFRFNTSLLQAIQNNKGSIHLMGLVSDGGVHSHIDHLLALASVCRMHFDGQIFSHAFTDGRDVDPKSGASFVMHAQEELARLDIPIVSVIGRYYAMDRDNRWERTKLAYDLLVRGIGSSSTDLIASILHSYEEGVTDEFIKPLFLGDHNGMPYGRIKDGDTVIFFNFRADRPRQLTEALSQHPVMEFDMAPLHIDMMTMTSYDDTYANCRSIFGDEDLHGTLGEYLSSLGKTQLRVAETEKYPHVSYFFSGGKEDTFAGESRILIPSPKVATYDLMPEMSALGVTDAVIAFIENNAPDFVCLNYANADMVGHTGSFQAAVKACETVDACLARLVPFCLEHSYSILIIADHGNADVMVNKDGSPNTAHTKSPVPVIFVSNDPERYTVREGILADIAPSILFSMGLPVPPAMTGNILLSTKI